MDEIMKVLILASILVVTLTTIGIYLSEERINPIRDFCTDNGYDIMDYTIQPGIIKDKYYCKNIENDTIIKVRELVIIKDKPYFKEVI